MLNSIENYILSGETQARARFHGDESRAAFESRHVREMLALENEADRITAKHAFETAYSRVSRHLRGI